ncbi:MAG: sn-glycerol-3-phosphate ABC transporter permease UgpE [Alphaproteobacteria bacterium]
MVENNRLLTIFSHAILIVSIIVLAFPIYVVFVASSLTLPEVLQSPMTLVPGGNLIDNYVTALTDGATRTGGGTPVWRLLLNTMIMALGISIGKIAISIISAYAIVFFRFPFRMFFFWLIFVTLMLPVEVRIVPTFEIAAALGLLNSYPGLILPLIASATATFFFRQFFLTIPDELIEAARVDGAGPVRFFFDMVLPLSKTNIAALFVILFIFGWNQFLWPLLITTDPAFDTIIIAINRLLRAVDDQVEWPLVMATTMMAMLVPILVVVLMQKWFVKGLIEHEK